MKNIVSIICSLLFLPLLDYSSYLLTESAKEVIRKADEKMRGKTSIESMNDYLIKESSIVKDYIPSFGSDTLLENRSCYKIKLIPKPGKPVIWKKIVVWLDKKEYLLLRAEFYDEKNILKNTMKSSELKMIGGRLLPSKVEIIPANKNEQKTIMQYTNIVFDKPFEDSFYTPENMKKIN